MRRSMWTNATCIELEWTLPAFIGGVLFLWRVIERGIEYWRILHLPAGTAERRDAARQKIYARGMLIMFTFLLLAEICFAYPGWIGMLTPNSPAASRACFGSLLVNGLLVGQGALCVVAVVDRVFAERLRRSVRAERQARIARIEPPVVNIK
jgi:hypothetical protein